MLTLGERIKLIRKSNTLNQVEFAKILGVSQGTLSEIEKDKYKPSTDIIISIHNNFKIDLEWLLINSNETKVEKKSYISKIENMEVDLLNLFRKLTIEDQEEIVGIIELKLKRYNIN